MGAGTYQIGSSSTADFNTISDALNAMTQNGICGPIVFNIESGTYNNQYVFSNIAGASASNTITFKSLSNNANDVKFVYENQISTSSAYVLHIDGGKYYKFKNLSFKSQSGGSYNRVAYISNGSNNIEFDSCKFISNSGATTAYSMPVYVEHSDSIAISNSYLSGGIYAMYFYGSSSDNNDEIIITDNVIEDFNYYGIYAYYGDNIEIKRNLLKEISSASNPRIIYLRYGNGNKIVDANILQQQNSSGYYGIYIEDENTSANSSNTSEITNNIINMNKTSGSGVYGLYIDNSDRIDIYFNTIFNNSTYSYSSGVYLYYSNYINFKNNSSHATVGLPVYSYYSNYFTTDYNNLIGDNYIGRRNSYSYSTLSQWQSAVSGDYNSYNVVPNYVSSNDLHLYDYTLNNSGTAVGITHDIDGDTRSTTNPDIGADEFNILARDIEMSEITSPNDTTGIGSRDVKVKIKNWGSTNLTTATFNWSVDGIAQTSYSWSGNLANLAESPEINIGSYNFTSGNHTIKVWSSNPNGSSDMNNNNDTLTKTVHAKLVPVIGVSPNPITKTITNCDDSLTVPLEIINSGGAILNYQIGAISGGYDSTSVQYYTYSGQNVYHYFSNIPTNIDTMTLVVTINGDYDSYSEYIDIYLDGVFYVQCMGQYQGGQSTHTYHITGSTLNSIIADGQVTVLYDNSSGVNSGYGTGLNQAQIIANGVNWISLLSSNSGSVNINDTNFINLKLNSLGLNNGSFNYDLHISSNDPGSPVTIVPVTMTVDGNPIISTASNNLTFGNTYTGTSLSDSLLVSNTGCDTLFITNTTSSNSSVFTALIQDSILLPNQSTYLNVDFSPAAVTTYNETITIVNNDVNKIINVSGTGLMPPQLTVTPNPINVTIQNCNDTAQVNLKLENTGSGNLTVNMAAPSDSVKVLMLTYGGASSANNNFENALKYYSNIYTDVEQYYSSSASSIQAKINSYEPDIIAIPYIGSGYSTYFSSIASDLQSFANNGGYIVFAGQYDALNMSSTGLLSGSRMGYDDYVTVFNDTPNDSLTIGIGSSFYTGGSEDFYYYNFTSSNVTNHIRHTYYGNDYDVVSSRPYGSGKVIYIGFHYYYTITTPEINKLAGNVVREKSHSKVTYIDFTSANFNINASNQVFKTITFDATGLSAGTYTNKIQFATNNPANPLVEVPCTLNVLNQMANPIDLGADTSHCGPLSLDAGSGYSTYLWSNNSSSQVITANTSGYYSVTVTDGGSCTSSDTIYVTINPSPNVSINSIPNNLCEYDAAINLIGNPNGGVFTGNGVSSNTFNPSLAGLGNHTITYTFTNSYNCTAYATKTVNVNAKPTASFSGLDSNYCPEESGDILIGSPSGGSFVGNGISGNTFNAISAGPGSHNISYIYTNTGGCSDTATQTTLVNSSLNINISNYASTYCEDDTPDSLNATPSGGTFIGNGMTNNVFDPILAGIGTHYIKYQVNNNGCLNTDSISITVNSNPTANLSGISGSICSNAGVQSLNTSPSGGIIIGNGVSGNTFNPSQSGLGNHTLIYTYTNSNGCSASDSLSISVVNPSTISFGNLSQNYCYSLDTIQLSAQPSGGNFSGNGVSGNTFIPQNAGVGSHYIKYQLTDANSCISLDSQLVNVIAPITASFSGLNANYCSNGSSSLLTGSPAGGIFAGSGIVNNTFDPTLINAGNYSVSYTYTDPYGCISSDTQFVNIEQAPVVNAGNDTIISSNTTASLAATASGGSGNYNYQWSPASLVANSSLANTTTVSLLMTTNFTITVSDNNTSCQNTDQKTVSVSGGQLSLSVNTSQNQVCEGDSIQLSALPSGGSGNYTYSWTSNPPGFNSTLQNPKLAPSQTRVYICALNDGTNSSTASIMVVVKPVPAVSLSIPDSVYCSNEADVALNYSPSGGVFSGSGIIGSSFSPANASIGISNITYTYTTTQGCVSSAAVKVKVNKAPSAFAGNDTTLSCANSGLQLGQQPYSNTVYVWSPAYNLSSPFVSNPYLSPNMSMNYTLKAIDTTNMCSESDTIQITITDAPTVVASNDTLICIGDSVKLTASGGTDYLWNGGQTDSIIYVHPTEDSVFTVIASVGQCADIDSIMVSINNPKPNLIPDTILCHNQSILLDAGSIWQSYQWNTGDNSQTIFVDSAGYGIGAHTFWVKVEDQMGCFGSDTVLITIDDCTGFEHILSDNFKIKVYPNPSNSDIYLDMEAENIDEIKLNIFNSSGKLIKSEIVSLNTGELTHRIDMSTYAKGIYILQINSDYFRKSLKIVLQ